MIPERVLNTKKRQRGSNIHLIGALRKEEKNKWNRKVCQEIMDENLPDIMRLSLKIKSSSTFNKK